MKAKNCIYKLGPFEPNFQNHYIPPYDCFLFISQTDQNEIAIFTNFFLWLLIKDLSSLLRWYIIGKGWMGTLTKVIVGFLENVASYIINE